VSFRKKQGPAASVQTTLNANVVAALKPVGHDARIFFSTMEQVLLELAVPRLAGWWSSNAQPLRLPGPALDLAGRWCMEHDSSSFVWQATEQLLGVESGAQGQASRICPDAHLQFDYGVLEGGHYAAPEGH